ncbi:grancalcin-like [Rhipicephalus microplus]|uniref:grancalcin-like n=1 Tax=Rhipicephalus microplus TaxID=6941 RepID=UPI001888194C|nr:peflin-like [Rhipicephalus microplus]
MDSRVVEEFIRRVGQRRTHPPIYLRTAALVLEFCTIRGATDCDDLLNMGCQAIQYWASVFQEFDLDRSGFVSNRGLEAALRECGYPVTGDLLACLCGVYSKDGRVFVDVFVKVCAVVGSVCP